jgi:hypothetical protein
MAFHTLASQAAATEEEGWELSGAVSLVLLLTMAATALLPKSIRREDFRGAENVRESLAQAQKFFDEDWEDIKETYKTGPFTNPATI